MLEIQQALEDLCSKFTENTQIQIQIGRNMTNNNTVDSNITVDFEYFQELYTALHQSNIWTSKREEYHLISYLYDDGIRSIYTVSNKPEFFRSEILQTVCVNCLNREYSIYITLYNKIYVLHYDNTSHIVNTKLVEYWEYIYQNLWVYNLRKQATALTKDLACDKQPIYTISLSLNYIPCLRSYSNLPLHIIEKASDLLGRYNHLAAEEKINLQLNCV